MNRTVADNSFAVRFCSSDKKTVKANNLAEAEIGSTYRIKGIKTGDSDLESFLFTLGCYEGEQITVISRLAENYVVSVKDARYSIDEELAEAIIV